MSVETCLEKCSVLVEKTKSLYPQVEVCIGEALPRKSHQLLDKSMYWYNNKSREFNSCLSKIPGIKVICHSNLRLMTRSLYQEDGVHLRDAGTANLVSNFKEVVNPLLGMRNYGEYDGRKMEAGNSESLARGGRKHEFKRHHGTGDRAQQKIGNGIPQKTFQAKQKNMNFRRSGHHSPYYKHQGGDTNDEMESKVDKLSSILVGAIRDALYS